MSYHTKKVNFWICNIFTRLKLQTIQYIEKLPTLSPICLILATYPQTGTPATSFLFVTKTHTTCACTCQPNTYMLPSLLHKWAFSPNNILWKSFYNPHSILTELPHSFFFKKTPPQYYTVWRTCQRLYHLSHEIWAFSFFIYPTLTSLLTNCTVLPFLCKTQKSQVHANWCSVNTCSMKETMRHFQIHEETILKVLAHWSINYFKLSWDYKTWIKYTNEIFNIHLWLII